MAHPTPTTPRLAALTLAVCALEVRPGERLQRLIPAGRFDAPRGALAGQGPWFMDAAVAAQVIARAASRSTQIPIDYEHQILLAERNGQPAPAAGWIDPRSLVWLPDADEPGLYGAVTWTSRAAALLHGKEYRYLSPVFLYHPETRDVLDLLHVALTNTPAIDEPVQAALSMRHARFAPAGTLPAHHLETPEVNETLKKLLAALGLPATTEEGDAVAAVAALKAKADAADTQIAALKTAAPDPARYVPVETMAAMQTQLAALTARISQGEVAQLVDTALADGRLLAPQKAWAESLGAKDMAALRQYLDTVQPMAALKGTQTAGHAPAGAAGATQTTDADLAVCRMLGLTADEYAKGKLETR